MSNIKLFSHQQDALNATANKNKVAYYLDMGLGKTFVGSEKMEQLGNKVNLVICQKSKVDDWIEHFNTHYPEFVTYDLTNKKDFDLFNGDYWFKQLNQIGVINYELAFRRKELLKLEQFTLILDESSLIQNKTAKRTKFIMKLKYANLILLSGTPTGGKYEKLWTQLNMLGYKLDEKAFYNMYVDYHYDDNEGFPIQIIDGYKNVERLKRKMATHGCVFMKSEEVFDLPPQTFIDTKVKPTKEYKKFKKDRIVKFSQCTKCEKYDPCCKCYGCDVELVGDSTLSKMLYERQLCGQYSYDKIEAFKDLVESTQDRLIVFYNFTAEYELLNWHICDIADRPTSIVNGQIKDLTAYEKYNDSVTFIQYQAGAMGLNLQKANKIIYFTPPLSSELFEQSKKRTHRIGQDQTCFYYKLICTNSIEERIYETLEMRKDYTDALFEKEDHYEK